VTDSGLSRGGALRSAKRFLPTEAQLIAMFRAVLCGLFLVTPERFEAQSLALRFAPETLRARVPHGLRSIIEWLPLSAPSVQIASSVYVTCACFGLAGFYTHWCLAGLLVAASYLFAIRQLTGSVLHDMHLLWLLALLCLEPKARDVSLDAWFAKKRESSEKLANSAKVAAAPKTLRTLPWMRTVLALVYWFPGYWKLRASGAAWFLSDNLQNQMHAKWLQNSVVPSLRMDHIPWLMKFAGAGTIAFELGFGLALLFGPRVRVVIALFGLAFHLSIEHWMLIPFSSLWLCYVVLLPTREECTQITPERGFLVRIQNIIQTTAASWPNLSMRAKVSSVAVAMLLVAIFERGIRGEMQSYPFACYPTFQWQQGDSLPDICVQITNGPLTPILAERAQQTWAETWAALGLVGAPYRQEEARSWIDRSSPKNPGLAQETVWECRRKIAPERWQEEPIKVRVLYTR
jgi:hypothetical protein